MSSAGCRAGKRSRISPAPMSSCGRPCSRALRNAPVTSSLSAVPIINPRVASYSRAPLRCSRSRHKACARCTMGT